MKIVIILLSATIFTNSAYAATERDYDRVTTYATLIGRAVACGENISTPMAKVGSWMDRTFYGSGKGTQQQIFIVALQYAAEQQKNGKSPDTCVSAVRAFKKTPWP